MTLAIRPQTLPARLRPAGGLASHPNPSSHLQCLRRLLAATASALLIAWAPTPAPADEARIDALAREVADLKATLLGTQSGPADAARQAEIERRIELLAQELETLRLGEAAVRADSSLHGLGPAASKIYRSPEGVSVGGYGEVLYQNFDSSREDDTPSGKKDEVDMLRLVLYFGYKFNDEFLFNSEIEYEHASTGEEGEVSVEFAYVDWLPRDEIGLRAGMVLLPMGLVNELHEPTVFLGARRPDVERLIIPSTWREIGLGAFGDVGPLAYRAYLVNGLDASGFTAQGIRNGRQDGSKALAESWAAVGRADYTGTPGLLAGASVYAGRSGQGLESAGGAEIEVSTFLYEGHADWKWRGLRVRGLLAGSQLGDVAALNEANGFTGSQSIAERQWGGYVEAGFDLLALRPQSNRSLVPFARWEKFDTQARVPAGYSRNPANEVDVLTFGLAFHPIHELVLKLDYQDIGNEATTGTNQFNVGLGLVF